MWPNRTCLAGCPGSSRVRLCACALAFAQLALGCGRVAGLGKRGYMAVPLLLTWTPGIHHGVNAGRNSEVKSAVCKRALLLGLWYNMFTIISLANGHFCADAGGGRPFVGRTHPGCCWACFSIVQVCSDVHGCLLCTNECMRLSMTFSTHIRPEWTKGHPGACGARFLGSNRASLSGQLRLTSSGENLVI